MRASHRPWVAALAGAALLLAACEGGGGGDDLGVPDTTGSDSDVSDADVSDADAPATASSDACELLDVEVIGELTDLEVEEGREDGTVADQVGSTCLWLAAEPTDRTSVSVSYIASADLPSDEEPQDGFDELRAFSPDAEAIEGLGRDAFRSPVGVTVLTDDAVLLVVTTEELESGRLEALAGAAVERADDEADGEDDDEADGG